MFFFFLGFAHFLFLYNLHRFHSFLCLSRLFLKPIVKVVIVNTHTCTNVRRRVRETLFPSFLLARVYNYAPRLIETACACLSLDICVAVCMSACACRARVYVSSLFVSLLPKCPYVIHKLIGESSSKRVLRFLASRLRVQNRL